MMSLLSQGVWHSGVCKVKVKFSHVAYENGGGIDIDEKKAKRSDRNVIKDNAIY